MGFYYIVTHLAKLMHVGDDCFFSHFRLRTSDLWWHRHQQCRLRYVSTWSTLYPSLCWIYIGCIWARFLSLARSKLRLCSANHRAGYFSNLAFDWLSIVWAYSENDTENGPWCILSTVTTGHQYHQISDMIDIRCTKSQNLNDSRMFL